jgi:acyl-CoA reductase-like NAD-dependent aldehyde dehydrogenase
LERLRDLIQDHEPALLATLRADLGKPVFESKFTETVFTMADIDHTLANLDLWMRPERVPTPLAAQPSSSKILREPLGVVCVISPWNYPVQLLLLPAVAAIAAGNAVILKPSELVPHTAAALAALIDELDDPAVGLVQGGVSETGALLEQRFDHIIYTGNSRVARIVMRAAAEHLTPVTLELGGKSPVVVTRNADIGVAARRIAWGKFLNAGQTCIAPDYVLVEREVHDKLVAGLRENIKAFYGSDPEASPDFARIVNDPHFHRLEKLLGSGKVVVGGEVDADSRYIAPTVLTEVTLDDEVMAEEIFGPILPVIAVDDLDEAIAIINRGDKPLALYCFSEDNDESRRVLDSTSSGGACVNGVVLHVGNVHLPFGGVGESGMGAYHGKAGFDQFSHKRSVMRRSTKVDPPILYPPYDQKTTHTVEKAFRLPDPRDVVAKVRSRLPI